MKNEHGKPNFYGSAGVKMLQIIQVERERLNTAYVTRLDAFINYKLFLADIMRKTFYDFERDVSLLAM
jgi:hypothetical protein